MSDAGRDQGDVVGVKADRVMLITGAGSGIGAALARRVAAPRQSLMLHSRGADEAARDRLAQVATECSASGATCATVFGDLAGRGAAERVVHETLVRFGALDQLVANAGHAQRQTLDTLDPDSFSAAFHAMPAAFASLVKHAAPALKTSQCGRVIALSSFVAHRYRADTPFAATAAAKAALESLARPQQQNWRRTASPSTVLRPATPAKTVAPVPIMHRYGIARPT